jgi:hypothetical protein
MIHIKIITCLFAHDFYLKLYEFFFITFLKFSFIKFKVLQNNLEKNNCSQGCIKHMI